MSVKEPIVSVKDSELLTLDTSTDEIQVITNGEIATVTDNNGAIYLLMSNDSSNNILHSEHQPNVGIITSKGVEPTTNSTMQIMNTEGIPVSINVNDLLSTINTSKELFKDEIPLTGPNIIQFSTITSAISSATSQNSNACVIQTNSVSTDEVPTVGVSTVGVSTVPNWAMNLHNCTLYGDTYTGYVKDEIEMDKVLNQYKKGTNSLFAIRQTPMSGEEENVSSSRLMWKSQYVPYDGIPFVNVGRRAIVMECEYGPRKKKNALKRMIQQHGHEKAIDKIPNLTCPVRLFVKKVRKFPQYRVPVDADPKVLRQLQEQSLKLVRQKGFENGEIRFYMQLPLPSAHRYHNLGTSTEMFQKELEDNSIVTRPLSVDSRVLIKIQEIVRQGYINPFTVRAAAKDYVENEIELGSSEILPHKHNKEFYPPLIEIQNIIQQTQSAMNSGLLTPLPTPEDPPPVLSKSKRKRTNSNSVIDSSLFLKKIPVSCKPDITGNLTTSITTVPSDKLMLDDISTHNETISLTLTDSQLEHFSVNNFTYSQIAQLAKIGLIALNNATKETTGDDSGNNDEISDKNVISDKKRTFDEQW